MNQDTLLLRQVHPAWVQAGRITSQLFKPTPKDNKRLSVYNGDLATPAASWRHYTGQLKHASFGVMAVTVQECSELELPVEPDPLPFPEHAVIVFENLTGSQSETKAKHLRQAAVARGWLFLAEVGD